MTGPLTGVRVLEFGAIGPGPFAAMVLADMGADVLLLDRPGRPGMLNGGGANVLHRGRPAVPVNLKDPEMREPILALIESADALIEGFRPGVMERLGYGPDAALERNPRLVYGRMTGFGQDGPMAAAAGHDVNYLAVAGVLGAMARAGQPPLFPLNLLGDFGGGGMLLAFGIVCGVLEARGSGQGQVIDASMVDGVALLSAAIHGIAAGGEWTAPGTNVLDSGAHFYEVYATADGGHVAVGAVEPQFYAALLAVLSVPPEEAPQWDRDRWPELKARFAEVFAARDRAAWAAAFETADACATVVLGLHEAAAHPHNAARGTFVKRDGVVQPGPAPRFSRTPGSATRAVAAPETALRDWGLAQDDVDRVLAC